MITNNYCESKEWRMKLSKKDEKMIYPYKEKNDDKDKDDAFLRRARSHCNNDYQFLLWKKF